VNRRRGWGRGRGRGRVRVRVRVKVRVRVWVWRGARAARRLATIAHQAGATRAAPGQGQG